ncbi:MAG TPA: GNAT family N-acetyltransferase [Gaiellaceae bacterium]|jgi:ribosomal protein S18 acetylase RimI-like enzyme|nr:GNAT family N-acetyltransferase [Gaiellaceae bacterium]
MSSAEQTTIRRLGPGDAAVVRKFADGEPQLALLADEATIFLAAFKGAEAVGFVFGYELQRRRGDPSILFVYELDVDEAHRRQGIGRRLMSELAEIARSRSIRTGFVLTEPDNDAANALYRSLDGERVETVMWDFTYAAG